MASRVQTAEGAWADPSVATFGAGPTAGNLLIAVAAQRSTTPFANFVLTGITGWTLGFGDDIALGDASDRFSWAVYWKIAGASEASAVTFDDGTANNKVLTIEEFQLTGDDVAFTFLNESHDSSNSPAVSPQGTGNTPSLPGTQFLLLSFASWKYTSFPSVVSWAVAGSNVLSTETPNDRIRTAMAWVEDTVGGIRNDSVTWNNSSRTVGAGILVFCLIDGVVSWHNLQGRNPLYNDMNTQLSR